MKFVLSSLASLLFASNVVAGSMTGRFLTNNSVDARHVIQTSTFTVGGLLTPGYVGIGLTNPTMPLDVLGQVRAVQYNLNQWGGTQTGMWVDGGLNLQIGGAGISDIILNSATGEHIRMAQNGNLGIGTNIFDPIATEKLKIDAGVTSSYNLISGSGTIDNYLQVNISNHSNGGNASTDYVATADNGDETINYIDMGINSSGYNSSSYTIGGINSGYLYTIGDSLTIGNATPGKSIIFHTGGTLAANERMRIDGSGNVGIATGTPAYTLDVNGNINSKEIFASTITVSTMIFPGGGYIGLDDAYGRHGIHYCAPNAVFSLGSDIADGDHQDSDSEGVVVYKPSEYSMSRIKADRFGLTSSTDSAQYYFRVDRDKLFYGNYLNNSRYTFWVDRASENVGIGTSSPSEKLYVVGNATFTGVVTASTFNAVGTAYQYNGFSIYDADGFHGNGSNLTGIVSADRAFELDGNGDWMPKEGSFSDPFFELDGMGYITVTEQYYELDGDGNVAY